MAESGATNWQSIISNLNPVTRIGNNLRGVRDNPGGTAISAGARLLGGLFGGPAGSAAAGALAGRINDWRGGRRANRLTNEQGLPMVNAMNEGLANQIWGTSGQSGHGRQGNQPGASQGYSPLMAMLGIPNYTQPAQTPSEGLPGITSSLEGTGYGPGASTLPAVNVTPRGVDFVGGFGRAPGSTSGVFHGVAGSGTSPLQYQSGVSTGFSPYIQY